MFKTAKTAITTGAWTAINIPSGVSKFTALAMSTEDGTDFYISETGADGDMLRWSGQFGVTFDTEKDYGSGAVAVCYVKATVNTNLGVIFV